MIPAYTSLKDKKKYLYRNFLWAIWSFKIHTLNFRICRNHSKYSPTNMILIRNNYPVSKSYFIIQPVARSLLTIQDSFVSLFRGVRSEVKIDFLVHHVENNGKKNSPPKTYFYLELNLQINCLFSAWYFFKYLLQKATDCKNKTFNFN